MNNTDTSTTDATDTGFDHTEINRIISSAEPSSPEDWALWDKKELAWLSDETSVRVYRGEKNLPFIGKWHAQFDAIRLSIYSCPCCRDRVEARRYDPAITNSHYIIFPFDSSQSL